VSFVELSVNLKEFVGAFPKKGHLSILSTTLEYNGVAAKTDKNRNDC